MFDVLFFLSVPRRLLKSSYHEGRGRGDHGNSGLSILDRELDGHTQTFLRVLSSQALSVVDDKRTQSPVALAISSPTFLGERPRGPILGARAEEAPTSPPVALKVLQ